MRKKKLLKAVLAAYMPIVGVICFLLLITFPADGRSKLVYQEYTALEGLLWPDLCIKLFYLASAVGFFWCMRRREELWFVYSMPYKQKEIYEIFWKAGVIGILSLRAVNLVSGWLQLSEVDYFAWNYVLPVAARTMLDLFWFSAVMAAGVRKRNALLGILELLLGVKALTMLLDWLDSVLVIFEGASAYNPGALFHNMITLYTNPVEANAASYFLKNGRTAYKAGSYPVCYVLLSLLLLGGIVLLMKKGSSYAGENMYGFKEKNSLKRFAVPAFIAGVLAVSTMSAAAYNMNDNALSESYEMENEGDDYCDSDESFEVDIKEKYGTLYMQVEKDNAGFCHNVSDLNEKDRKKINWLLIITLGFGLFAAGCTLIVGKTSFGGGSK